jgi:hypothetical protein
MRTPNLHSQMKSNLSLQLRGNGMSQRKQLNQQIDERLTEETTDVQMVKENLIEEYKRLNEKCDTVIAKIKIRKGKKTPVASEAK